MKIDYKRAREYRFELMALLITLLLYLLSWGIGYEEGMTRVSILAVLVSQVVIIKQTKREVP